MISKITTNQIAGIYYARGSRSRKTETFIPSQKLKISVFSFFLSVLQTCFKHDFLLKKRKQTRVYPTVRLEFERRVDFTLIYRINYRLAYYIDAFASICDLDATPTVGSIICSVIMFALLFKRSFFKERAIIEVNKQTKEFAAIIARVRVFSKGKA